ncbi:hypothetical protein, conserved [Babesia ovata]|uniref:C3H1-type domain-containing protein n=1 Tax=Babesia ovata TaxID=189622 RepID=A0A2H6KK26_9APIC|nr:uncharacterized protein BOVATA_048390 [Babesia ovata]GBE63346.1 hypothetical protein, conserved [Babesia ovata]
MKSLETLKELCDFAESLKTNENKSPHDLLDKLCTGLEKFLGYSNGNYTGDGIVYSDLDRLCDGVMAFLHGVLSNIKPKLGLHSHHINDAIRLLNTNKHSGKEGFNAAIGEVVKGVNKYNEGVKASNESITDRMTTFMEQMSRMKSDVAKYNDHNSVRDLDVKVSQCLMEAQQYYHGMDAQKSSNIKDLQNELEKDVNNATEIIRYQRGRLSAIHDTQKRHLQQVTELVESRIDAARDLIKSTTTEKIRDFVRDLNMKIDMLSRKVWDADAALKKYVTDIEGWINKADDAVDKAITKIDCILDQVDGSRRKDTNKQNLEEAVEDLRKKTLHFLEAYNYAKGVYTAAAAKLPDLLGKVTQAIKGLDSVIMNDLESLEAKFKTALGEYVKEQVDALIDAINAADASGGGGMEAKAGPGIKGLKNVSALMETIERADELLKDTIELAMSDFHDFTGSSTWSKGDKNPVIIALKDDLESAIGTVMTEYLKSTDEFRTQMKAYKPYVESNGAIDRAIQDVRGKTLGKFTDPINVKSIDNESINQNANNFRTNFGQLCKAITDAAADGNASAKDKLKELKGLISKENPKHTEKINGARDTILENIKTNYVVFLRAQLHEFATKVNELLTNLPTKVASDADKHYKGFMKELKGNLDDNLIGVNMSNLGTVSPKVRDFFIALLTTLNGNPEIMLNRDNIPDLQHKLSTLLSSLSKYDRPFQKNLSALASTLSTIRPASYSAPTNPLLDVLKTGLTGMHDELQKAYVSVYDGEAWQPEHENKYAKICFTCLPTLTTALTELREQCETDGDWKTEKLCLMNSTASNPLGNFLDQCGYTVAQNNASKDGELQHKSEWNGQKILADCLQAIPKAADIDHLKTCMPRQKQFTVLELLRCILSHRSEFFQVGHISTFAARKHPSSVNEMLVWLTGLPHNFAHKNTKTYVKTLYKVPDGAGKPPKRVQFIDAHPSPIGYRDIDNAINNITSLSPTLVTAIVGHGDLHSLYACDLYDNSMKLHYPQSGEDCFNMLVDIIRRCLPPLKFLLTQCSRRPERCGWGGCLYGRDVMTTNSQCNYHSTGQPTCQSSSQPTDQPECQATCRPTCQPACRPTSPLMSYLNDCLPGHLPHQLTSVGCRSVCTTCPGGKPGQPCLTPLGFRAFSGSTKSGLHLSEIIDAFIRGSNISPLLCVIPKPPSTLPEHIAFALSLVNGWRHRATHPFRNVIELSIRDVSIDLVSDSSDLTNAFVDAYGSQSATHTNCNHAHLMSIIDSGVCKSNENIFCTPNVSSLCRESYGYFVNKHSNLYLSWALYLPWQLLLYLEALCDAFKNIFCHDWGCRSCLNGSTCKRGEHGLKDNCGCPSIVNCRGALPTLYRYGVTFGEDWTSNNAGKATTCFDFCTQLNNILKSSHFSELFKAIDNFIYCIRLPFMTLLLTLWSLSLLYLLHIAVVRLDVLRIRSHLRSPSSHRIAAQSLLAAARVRALANVKYFSP